MMKHKLHFKRVFTSLLLLAVSAFSWAQSEISFADAKVKAICVANWDTNGDGELDEDEAAAVTSLNGVFTSNKTITSFNELQYFTGLAAIDDNDFFGCSALTSITIPNNVTSIGRWVFQDCSALASVTIPNSVASIGNEAFYGCSSIKNINIPNSVTTINERTFSGCSGLTSITIPESVTRINSAAFHGCTSLIKAEFASIESLCGISFSDGVRTSDGRYRIYPSNPLSYAHHLYIDGQEVKDVVIPEGVTSIGAYAFFGGTDITSVTLPGTLTSTGNYSFGGCTGLTAVRISDLASYCGISFGTDTPLSYAHKLYLNGEEVAGEVNLPDGITSVSDAAFEACTGITSVVIPEGVTSIGRAAFKSTTITSVTLPGSVTSIDAEAFNNCPLRTVVAKNEKPSHYGDVFSVMTYSHTPLYVPQNSFWDYVYGTEWYRFNIIKEYAFADVQARQAYMLAEIDGMNYTVYNSSRDALEVKEYSHQVDESSLASNWVAEAYGSSYALLNLGAEKYADIDAEGRISLSETPKALDIEFHDGVTTVNGREMMMVINDNDEVTDVVTLRYTPSAEDGTFDANAPIYDLNGRRLSKKPKSGYYIQGGKKYFVEK